MVLKRLVSLQTSFNHPNVVTCLGYEETATEFRVLYEHCAGGTLTHLLQRKKTEGRVLGDSETAFFALHVARGLAYLHASETAHRDVRSGSVLLDGNQNYSCEFVIKLTAGICPRETPALQCQPPESPRMNPQSPYGFDPMCSDIWSFGMLLIELSTMSPPYPGFDIEKQKAWIREGKLPPNTDRSSQLFPLIKQCTQLAPEERITAEGCLAFLTKLFPPDDPVFSAGAEHSSSSS
jgi:serine/threonine protein kinase